MRLFCISLRVSYVCKKIALLHVKKSFDLDQWSKNSLIDNINTIINSHKNIVYSFTNDHLCNNFKHEIRMILAIMISSTYNIVDANFVRFSDKTNSCIFVDWLKQVFNIRNIKRWINQFHSKKTRCCEKQFF